MLDYGPFLTITSPVNLTLTVTNFKCIIVAVMSYQEEGLKISRPAQDSNPDLYQWSHQANWELVALWVNDKPLDDGYLYCRLK